MATPTCTFCGENQGVLMDTNLDDGETQVVCGNDLMAYILGMAATITQGMTVEQAEAYAIALDAIKANDPRKPKPPAPPAASKRRPRAVPEAAQDGSESAPDGKVALLEPCAQCGGMTASGDAQKLTCDGCGAVLATADEQAG